MSALGDSFEPLGAHLDDPYSFYARARVEEPVFWSPRMNAWAVTRYDDVYAVLRDNETYSNANAIRTLAEPPAEVINEFMQLGYPMVPVNITADGALHRRLRLPFARAFAAEMVTRAEPLMRTRVEECVDAIEADGHAEFMRALARPLPLTIVTRMYGIEELDERMVKAASDALFSLQGNLASTGRSIEEQVESMRTFVKVCRIIKEVVNQRRAEPRKDDLTSMFIEANLPADLPPDAPLTIEQEALIVFGLADSLLPGHETTAPQLGNGMRHLLEHRDQWELLCERPELIEQAVEEFCRYDTSVPGMFRVAKEATTIAGQEIPAGGELFLALLSANRDEAFCERPDVFDITREPTKHLAFGYGAHYCIGAETGRREMQVALEILTHRLPGLRLAGRPVEIEPVFVTRGPHELHVEF